MSQEYSPLKIVHDLRDPLHTTACLVQLIRRKCSGVSADLDNLLPLLENSVTRLTEVVDTLAKARMAEKEREVKED
jgi:hypothetical protein